MEALSRASSFPVEQTRLSLLTSRKTRIRVSNSVDGSHVERVMQDPSPRKENHLPLFPSVLVDAVTPPQDGSRKNDSKVVLPEILEKLHLIGSAISESRGSSDCEEPSISVTSFGLLFSSSFLLLFFDMMAPTAPPIAPTATMIAATSKIFNLRFFWWRFLSCLIKCSILLLLSSLLAPPLPPASSSSDTTSVAIGITLAVCILF
mmetsp:Transcript_9634/g.12908  ORF Transcript_9634/g.12908 Transcript_9634/m.12908 type:complete len:205 (-) Transcript_9634:343-957(-)